MDFFLYFTFTSLFLFYVFGHVLADFFFQTEYIATFKNPYNTKKLKAPPGQKRVPIWPHVLFAHSVLHGFFVFVATYIFLLANSLMFFHLAFFAFIISMILALIEIFLHFCIDYTKCSGAISVNTDQFLHYLTKTIYVLFIVLLTVY